MKVEGISFFRNEEDELCALAVDSEGKEWFIKNLYVESVEDPYLKEFGDSNLLNVTFSYDFDR